MLPRCVFLRHRVGRRQLFYWICFLFPSLHCNRDSKVKVFFFLFFFIRERKEIIFYFLIWLKPNSSWFNFALHWRLCDSCTHPLELMSCRQSNKISFSFISRWLEDEERDDWFEATNDRQAFDFVTLVVFIIKRKTFFLLEHSSFDKKEALVKRSGRLHDVTLNGFLDSVMSERSAISNKWRQSTI